MMQKTTEEFKAEQTQLEAAKWTIPFVTQDGISYMLDNIHGKRFGTINYRKKPDMFFARLKLNIDNFGDSRGRVYYKMIDDVRNVQYHMNYKQYLNLIDTAVINCGHVEGWWSFVKLQNSTISISYFSSELERGDD